MSAGAKWAHVPAMMEMEHPALVALICVALLIWIRSTVPYDKRTRIELWFVERWHWGVLVMLLRLRAWFER